VKEVLLQYVNYNLWANQRLTDLCSQLPEEYYDAEVKSSFLSLRKTFFHIWDAEYIWLSRLKNYSFTTWPSKSYSSETPVRGMLNTSEEWCVFVKDAEETDFSRHCSYTNIEGKKYSQSVFTILTHCMNHSSFHRGQIVTMLRNLGISEGIPSTDLITYSRTQEV
jgi:uncharacterized damage-inducible protein DinB